MLNAQSISFRYGAHEPWLFKDFSLTIQPGEFVGLQGVSGQGKTTLGKMFAGYLLPCKGKVTADETPIPVKLGDVSPVQLLFQHPETAVNPRWRVRKIISEGYTPNETMLERFKIHRSWLERYPAELSSGQLSRIAMVRALTPYTRYLVADEISSSLDAINQARLWKTLKSYTEKLKIGVLVISHDPMLIHRLCDTKVELSC